MLKDSYGRLKNKFVVLHHYHGDTFAMVTVSYIQFILDHIDPI